MSPAEAGCGAHGGVGISAARTASGTCCAAPAAIPAPSGWGPLPAIESRPSRGPSAQSRSATSRHSPRATWCNWTAFTAPNWPAPAGALGRTPPLMSPPAILGPPATKPRAIPPRAIPRPWPATAGRSSALATTTPASSPAPPSGRQQVAPHLDLVPQAADQINAFAFAWQHTGNGLAPFGDDQAVGVELIQQRQALLLELRGLNIFHDSPTTNVNRRTPDAI